MSYSLSDFDYELPKELIAQHPAKPRDHSRLLVYDRKDRSITDDYFYNLIDFLPDETSLVVNNSKVEKCRLLFEKGKKEIFILEAIDKQNVRALVRPGKKFKTGKKIQLADQISVVPQSIEEDGIRILKLDPQISDPIYNQYRYTPFPPYIEQDESYSDEYQTLYAKPAMSGGSKAAPTAGLHFTGRLMKQLKKRGIPWIEVTLHVGLGTFAPVKTENIEKHTMHSEWYEIDHDIVDELNRAKQITAVGTTSLRVLEASVGQNRRFSPKKSKTDIFIRPGYRFKAVDSLVTNFHLPKSTLLMLVAAFMGFEEMHRVYAHARKERYRFYSFGDAMLIT